jgi:FlaA1/EpsC-like NDP-sugar epimerase
LRIHWPVLSTLPSIWRNTSLSNSNTVRIPNRLPIESTVHLANITQPAPEPVHSPNGYTNPVISLPHKDPTATQIDWYSFLGRPRLPAPSEASLTSLREASILVTGAAGSIGSALAVRLAQLAPSKLVLLDASEQALYQLDAMLATAGLRSAAKLILGSITDTTLLDDIFSADKPTIIFHAAAYKHGPLLESQPLAAIANNALGTRNLFATVRKRGNARVVLLSTDKAVAPASILGATKHIAEQITLAQNGIILRLCNVLGSKGSVVEAFLHQIDAGLTLTLTHRDAERFFLTNEEAVDLLLIAATEALSGSLLVPQITNPQSILALAEFLIVSSSRTRMPMQFTGLRPGDKLSETLWSSDEEPRQTQNTSYLEIKQSSANSVQLESDLDDLADAVRERDLALAIDIVRMRVPANTPSTTVLECRNIAIQGASKQ